jgi:LytTr DNA-binding domain
MFKMFRQPFPAYSNTAKAVKFCAIAGLCVLFVVFFILPGGNSGPVWKKFAYSVCFGFITFAVSCFNTIVLPSTFPKFFTDVNWNVGKEILSLLLNVFFIGIANQFFSWYAFNQLLTFKNFIATQFGTLTVGVFPITVIVLLKQQILLKRYAVAATKLDNELHKKTGEAAATSSPANEKIITKNIEDKKNELPLVELVGDTQQDKLVIPVSELLFIAASDNYVKITCLQNASLKNIMLRATLKKMEDILNAYPCFYRCHRTYIVNLGMVTQVSGNAQGYKLHVLHTTERVPVSRSLNKEISDKLLQFANTGN